MAQKHRFHQQRNKRAAGPPVSRRELPVYEPKPIIEYGKPFMVLEDSTKQTFEFKDGEWIPFALSIADCKREGLVKELPQKVNKRTRYEIRMPVGL